MLRPRLTRLSIGKFYMQRRLTLRPAKEQIILDKKPNRLNGLHDLPPIPCNQPGLFEKISY